MFSGSWQKGKNFQSESGAIYGISQPVFSRFVIPVITTLNQLLNDQNVMPRTNQETTAVKRGFIQLANISNVIGAIDGTLIQIRRVNGDDEHLYVCRKDFHAINTHAVYVMHIRWLFAGRF